MPPITIQQLLHQVKQKIDALDAELLIAHVLKKPREWILAHPETRVLKVHKVQKFIKSVNQRAKGVPLAYLTGHKEFFGLDFEVNKDVLIPRPDTETMVECVIERLKTYDIGPMTTLVDVGTGSGCIPISIVKTLKHKNIKTIATDISRKALAVARRNARKHHVKASLRSAHVAGKIKFLQGNLLSPILKTYNLKHVTCNLIITANLPYLTSKQFDRSPTINHEPKQALVAKNNGLALYKKLLKQIKQVTGYRLQVTGFLEISPSQSRPITRLIKSILPTAQVKITKDLSGLDRVVKIET